MDEFEFRDPDEVAPHRGRAPRASLALSHSSKGSASTSTIRSGLGKTKAARKMRKLEQKRQEVDKSVRFSFHEDENAEASVSSSSMKALSSKTASPFSSSVASSSTATSRNSRRRKRSYGAGSSVTSSKRLAKSASPTASFLSKSASPTRSKSSSPTRSTSKSTSTRSRSNRPSSASGVSSMRSSISSIGESSTRSSRSEDNHDVDDDDDDDEPAVVVKGAGLNVLAVQDAGAHRMLLDEFSYLLSTIRTATTVKISSSSSSNSKSMWNEAENTSLLWDLAFLLSTKKNRTILWTYAHDTALSSILKLVGSIPSPNQKDQQQPSQSDDDDDDDDDNGVDSINDELDQTSRSSRRRRGGGKVASSSQVSSSSTRSNASSTSKRRRRQGVGGDPTKTSRRTQQQEGGLTMKPLSVSGYEALASVIYFVSLDCTVPPSASAAQSIGGVVASSSNRHASAAARKMRKSILQHETAIRGTSHLLLVGDSKLSSATRTDKKIVDELPPAVKAPTVATTSECSSVISQSTMDSTSSPKKSNDPTSSGRRKRKMRKKPSRAVASLDPIVEEQSPDSHGQSQQKDPVAIERLSFTDSPEPPNKTKRMEPLSDLMAQKVRAKVKWHSTVCDCPAGASEGNQMFVKGVILEALNRIVQGKEAGDETSCLDGEDESEDEGDDQSDAQLNKENNGNHNDDDGDVSSKETMAQIEASNPLMVTNKLLLESEALPNFAIAMAESLEASVQQSLACNSCRRQLLHQISGLATLVDGACLLSDDNREELCANGRLVAGVLQVLSAVSKKNKDESRIEIGDDMLLEVALISIRTLTSLTHENTLAGQQLRSSITNGSGEWGEQPEEVAGSNSGVEVLLSLLHSMVTRTKNLAKEEALKNDDASKQRYDMIVFCLNTLTNVVETAHVNTALSAYLVPTNRKNGDHIKEESFLLWLTQWIVDETSTFRDSVLNGTFGKKGLLQEEQKESFLQKDAEEHLVTAGNGFILLACIIIHSDEAARESILARTPGGFRLIINSLKSFCNFYYYSVGDLSVAIVAPVKRLIMDLEKIGSL